MYNKKSEDPIYNKVELASLMIRSAVDKRTYYSNDLMSDILWTASIIGPFNSDDWLNRRLGSNRIQKLENLSQGQRVGIRLLDWRLDVILDTVGTICRKKNLGREVVVFVKYGHRDSRPIKLVSFIREKMKLPDYHLSKLQDPRDYKSISLVVLSSHNPQTLVDWCCYSLRMNLNYNQRLRLQLPEELKEKLV